jgi:glucose/arabinose dehydrogenase
MRTGLWKIVGVLVIGAALLLPSVLSVEGQSSTDFKLDLRQVATGFNMPLFLTHAGDGSGRIFVVEKGGQIQILRNGQKGDKPFLDITRIVNSASSERGLLGLAFHPKYKDNGFFFVYYTDSTGDLNIVRYKVSSDPDVADPASAKPILKIQHRTYPNHNGGMLAFGPDGFLYMGIGDGGSGGDPNRNGQNTKVLLAKLLRIDVDNGDPYGIPKDNPFADGTQGRPEVWAYGLRNPWRFSFDRQTGDLYIADVGQNAYEEVNVQKAGAKGGLNYGWNVMEGQHCYPASASCSKDGLVLPVFEYSHSQGISVTGGYVYRGQKFPKLQGYYFFADYGSGRIWAMKADSSGAYQTVEALASGQTVSSFGEDEAGEVYITNLATGEIFQLADNS